MVYFESNNSNDFAFRPFSEMDKEVAYGMNSHVMLGGVTVLAYFISVGIIYLLKPSRVMEKDESGNEVVSKKMAFSYALIGAAVGAIAYLAVHRFVLADSAASAEASPLLE